MQTFVIDWASKHHENKPCNEITMSITISLPPETEEKLRARAAQIGQSLDRYVQELLEREVLGSNGRQTPPPPSPDSGAPHAGMTFDEILAPIRKEFEQSGMSEEELDRLLQESLDEVRSERQRACQ